MDTQNNQQNIQSSLPSTPSQSVNPVVLKSEEATKWEGRVIEALPNAFFKISLTDKREIIGFLSGKMRLNRIKILPGDKVTVEMSPYDDKKGRIVYRLK